MRWRVIGGAVGPGRVVEGTARAPSRATSRATAWSPKMSVRRTEVLKDFADEVEALCSTP